MNNYYSIWLKQIGVCIVVFFWVSGILAQDYDIIIRNGQLVDGTGNPWYYADIGIQEDRISKIGNLDDATAGEEIDATGLTICPGFIDIHSHADGPFGHRMGMRSEHWKLRAAHNMVMQGVTTLVVNQDGRSPRSIRAQRMELEENGFGPNVILMIGHNSIRRVALGDDYQRLATPQEMSRMKEMIREAMEAGAFGMTAGLEYVPGRWSDTEEVIELVGQLKPYGGIYIVHERSSGTDPMWFVPSQHGVSPGTMLDNVKEVIQVAEMTGVPSCATHIKVKGTDYWGSSQALIYQIQQARSRGVDIWADSYPYNTTGSDGNTVLIPDWALDRDRWSGPLNLTDNPAVQEIRYDQILSRLLEESDLKANYEKDVKRAIERRGGRDQIIVFDYPDSSFIGSSLQQIAERLDIDLIDVVTHLQINGYHDRPGGARLRGFSLNEIDLEAFAAQPWLITASDAGVALPEMGPVHARFYGTFPRKIAHYALNRGVLSFEDAIRTSTSLPAQFLGLKDRGLLREGNFADITIIDKESIQDHATFENPHQYPSGINYVMINGQWMVKESQLRQEFPGRIIDIKESKRYKQ